MHTVVRGAGSGADVARYPKGPLGAAGVVPTVHPPCVDGVSGGSALPAIASVLTPSGSPVPLVGARTAGCFGCRDRVPMPSPSGDVATTSAAAGDGLLVQSVTWLATVVAAGCAPLICCCRNVHACSLMRCQVPGL